MTPGILALRNRKIILGVTGSIAAYKSLEVLRLLIGEGAKVHVVMSTNATRFITPLTFEALSGNPVYHQVFDSNSSLSMEHIRVSESADLLLIAPATAGMIGKMANGIADDALSNLFVSFCGPVIVPPKLLLTMAPDAATPPLSSNSIVFALPLLIVPEFVMVAFVEPSAAIAPSRVTDTVTPLPMITVPFEMSSSLIPLLVIPVVSALIVRVTPFVPIMCRSPLVAVDISVFVLWVISAARANRAVFRLIATNTKAAAKQIRRFDLIL